MREIVKKIYLVWLCVDIIMLP